MGLDNIQKQVDEWANQFNPAYFPALEQLSCLTEETGEVARELNHLHGTKKKKDEESKLGKELADVMFTVCCIANSHGLTLQQFWDELMQKKLYGRDKDRFEKKDNQ
jgi:NTP pyrophosphatase (non-canonical NTP hydrolase)